MDYDVTGDTTSRSRSTPRRRGGGVDRATRREAAALRSVPFPPSRGPLANDRQDRVIPVARREISSRTAPFLCPRSHHVCRRRYTVEFPGGARVGTRGIPPADVFRTCRSIWNAGAVGARAVSAGAARRPRRGERLGDPGDEVLRGDGSDGARQGKKKRRRERW